MRAGCDPRVWFTTELFYEGFMDYFWQIVVPPLYTPKGGRSNFWAITSDFAKGPPMPSLPLSRAAALDTFMSMHTESLQQGSTIRVPLVWVLQEPVSYTHLTLPTKRIV